MDRIVDFNVVLMQRDMVTKGWEPTDLADRVRCHKSTISRFFSGEHRTAKTAKKIAKALGQPLERYILEAEARL